MNVPTLITNASSACARKGLRMKPQSCADRCVDALVACTDACQLPDPRCLIRCHRRYDRCLSSCWW